MNGFYFIFVFFDRINRIIMNPGKLSARIALELQWIRSGGLIFIKPIRKCRGGAIVGAADIGEFHVTIF